jgi:hypothetical protein
MTRPASRDSTPWRDLEIEVPPEIPTMISGEEMRYCFWLTSEAWDGRGGVVEIGPWLGGSTWCLAAGMEANPRAGTGKLHVVDNFRWRPFMSDRAPLDLEPDASFRTQFERNLARKKNLLVVHEAALPDDDSAKLAEDSGEVRTASEEVELLSVEALPEEIGILFIDGAKSWRAFRWLLEGLGPRFVPGKTIIVCQDCQAWLAYWVPMLIGLLLETGSLAPLHTLTYNTVSFRVNSSLPTPELDASPPVIDEVSIAEGREWLRETERNFDSRGDRVAAALVRLSEVAFLGTKGSWEEATGAFRAVEASWPWLGRPVNQLERARSWLASHSGSAPPVSARARSIELFERVRAGLSRRLRR